MKINNIEVKESKFAFDGCHKMYLIESKEDIEEAIGYGYEIKPINQLEETYNNSYCELKYIRRWKTLDVIVPQFENAKFEYE